VDFTFLTELFYETRGKRLLLRAMPVLLGSLCVLAIAYRYYSAFLAARVAALNDSLLTPAHRFYDGQNYHPTNKWVLFGHHFAAISGAGPLIGPVLAIQFGYFPGLLWLVIGVCLAGAVQDMLVLASSVRRDGKSLAEIARTELGPWANAVVSAAILFIVIIALAGLGMVVVKALGGEEVKMVEGMHLVLPEGKTLQPEPEQGNDTFAVYRVPEGSRIRYLNQEEQTRPESFLIKAPRAQPFGADPATGAIRLPAGVSQVVPGSSWGTFTIACTIPIALFVGLYMYRLRKGHVIEASLIGAAGVVAATIIGGWIPGSRLGEFFSLTREQTIVAMMIYGFVASVLPVWLLLCPRDYLSSFLKIGTIALLVFGVAVANPTLEAPPVNEVFLEGGPTFKGNIFPFVFICIMCGAISGFHALVSSGTTPKMIDKESDIRVIGYGAMLMEGVVGIVALIAAASLDTRLYFDINTDLTEVATYQNDLERLDRELGNDTLHKAGVRDLHQLQVLEEEVGNESLRGRTGGAVTLAVGIAIIFTEAMAGLGLAIQGLIKYWYHFAIMFEALFILTTIDTGTRIARFLLQEVMGKAYAPFEKTDWLPGAVLSTALVTLGWGVLIWSGSISTIWPMFGIANQLLAVIALCVVTTLLVNTGRGRYVWVTIPPMLFVITTTMTAGVQLITDQFPRMIRGGKTVTGYLNIGLTVFVMTCVATLLLIAVSRWVTVWMTTRNGNGSAARQG
jgi:carbon starvation protein